MDDQAHPSHGQQHLTVDQVLQALHVRIHALEAELSQRNIQPVAANVQSSEPKPIPPDKYDGNRSSFRDFKVSVENFFRLQPIRYGQAYVKTGYVGSLLTGAALSWYRTLIESNDASLNNYATFMDHLQETFGDPHIRENAQRALRQLCQGNRSCVAYTADFRRIALDTGFNEEALIAHFRYGLIDAIKDQLANSTPLTTLEAYIQHCIRIDHRLYERRVEKGETKQIINSGKPKASSSHYEQPRPSTSSTSTTPSSSHPQMSYAQPSTGVSSMDLDSFLKNGKLTRAERERRVKLGLCHYCGGSGHDVANCPVRTSKAQRLNAVSTSVFSAVQPDSSDPKA
jgi:hypothetical protein